MSRRTTTIVALSATALILFAGILLMRRGGFGRAPFRLADGGLPNILLVTIDTLRGDHVDYDRAAPPLVTPELDALAAQSTVFLATTSPAPATRPAMASLFTGTYPGRHGITNNSGRLDTPQPVLAEILHENGYGTVGLYGNLTLGPAMGFQRGFDSYQTFASGRRGSKDVLGVRMAREWLESAPPQPWLLWVHLMDPHGPYDSAPPDVLATVPRDDSLPDRVLPKSASNFGLGMLPRYQALPGVKRASDYRLRYRADVKQADAQLGPLLRTLTELGLDESTLVIVTADHGEGLGEREYYFQHGAFPYESSVRVPLLFRLPGRIPAGRRESASVSLVDVLPTLLRGLGLPLPEGVQGRDLSAAVAGGEIADAPAFSVSVRDNQISSVRLGQWKLVHTPLPPRYAQPNDPFGSVQQEERFELFDLASDPGESNDLSAKEPERVGDLEKILAQWEAEHGVPRGPPRGEEVPEVDPELRKHLRALGYLD